MVLIAALDVGTSRIKGALYRWPETPRRAVVGASAVADAGAASPAGALPLPAGPVERAERIATVSVALPAVRFVGLLAEQDATDVLAAVSSTLAQLAAAAPSATWSALALATQRGTLVPLDAAGVPAAPLVSWLDRRTLATGGDRWDWYLQHAPGVAVRTAQLLTLMSWLTRDLAGVACDTAQTQAAESGRRGDAARVVLPAHVAGPTTGTLARALGLPPKLPLVVAGGDKNGELVGAGCVAPRHGVVSFGTAVSLGLLVAGSPPRADGATAFVTRSHVPGLTQVEVGLPFGGGIWSWLAGLFPEAARALADRDLTDETPLFLPYLAGRLGVPAATGSWHALTPTVTGRDLVAAGLEGILMELRDSLAALSLGDAAPTEVTLTGGGTRSPVLAAWLADALGVPVRVVPGGDTGLAGAAMCAAVALGWAVDWTAAARAFAPDPWPPHHPRPAAAARWERRHERWRTLVEQG